MARVKVTLVAVNLLFTLRLFFTRLEVGFSPLALLTGDFSLLDGHQVYLVVAHAREMRHIG